MGVVRVRGELVSLVRHERGDQLQRWRSHGRDLELLSSEDVLLPGSFHPVGLVQSAGQLRALGHTVDVELAVADSGYSQVPLARGSAMAHCSNNSEKVISRSWLYKSNIELIYTPTGSVINTHINEAFAKRCDSWCSYVYSYFDGWAANKIDWIGTLGVGRACGGDFSWHHYAEALDLSRVRFTNGTQVDRYDWQSGTLSKRRAYLAVAALTRVYMKTTLTGWYNAAHADHIHFDNGGGTASVPAFRTNQKSDVTLVQAAANNLNSAGLVIDGVWGPKTSTAYENLRTKFNLRCQDPKASASAFKTFLVYIGIHGVTNKPAGTYKAAC